MEPGRWISTNRGYGWSSDMSRINVSNEACEPSNNLLIFYIERAYGRCAYVVRMNHRHAKTRVASHRICAPVPHRVAPDESVHHACEQGMLHWDPMLPLKKKWFKKCIIYAVEKGKKVDGMMTRLEKRKIEKTSHLIFHVSYGNICRANILLSNFT